MGELLPPEDIEAKIIQVNLWVDRLNLHDELAAIDRGVLRQVFEACAANTEIEGSERSALREYKNSDRAPAMRTVWGTHYKEFSDWTAQYADKWEQDHGLVLPTIRQKSKKDPDKILVYKNSGMLQLFGTWTQLAALTEDEYAFDEAKRLTEARAGNGRMWADGQKKERQRIDVPSSDKPKFLSSYPPGFPKDAWEMIKTWRTVE